MPAVLITGASSGIGAVTAIELARAGWHVYASMRNPEKRAGLEQALTEAGLRDRVDILPLDVTRPDSIEKAASLILARGDLQAVVHNAGIAVGGAFEDLSEADIRLVFETNVFGVMALTRAILPAFRARGGGRLILVSSDSAFAGEPALSAYCASKWALEGWGESLRYELAPFGIDVILVEPGPYRTQIWSNAPRRLPADSPYLPWLRRVYQAAEAHVAAVARDPQEVAVVIRRVLATRRPHFRYPVGPLAHLSHQLRGKIPTTMLQMLVARYLGIQARNNGARHTP